MSDQEHRVPGLEGVLVAIGIVIASLTITFFPEHSDREGPILLGLSAVTIVTVTALWTGRRLMFVLAVATVARVSMAWLLSIFDLTPHYWDEDGYHFVARVLLGEWETGVRFDWPGWIKGSYWTYSGLSAVFYGIFGADHFTMRVVNALCGSAIPVYVYRLGLLLSGSERGAFRAAAITALMPSYVFFTSLHMRDALVWLLSMSLLYLFVHWLLYRDQRRLFGCVVLLAATTALRSAMLPLFLLCMGPFVWVAMTHRMRTSFIGWPMAWVALPAILIAGVAFLFAQGWAPGLEKVDVRYFDNEMVWRASSGRSGYLLGMRYEGWGDVIAALPTRVLHFAFGPPLWTADTGPQVLIAIEGLFFALCILGGLRAVIISRSRWNLQVAALLIVFASLGIVSNAVIDSNYGTASRHRLAYNWVFVLLAVSGTRQGDSDDAVA